MPTYDPFDEVRREADEISLVPPQIASLVQ